METLNIQCIEQQQVLITLTLTDSNGAPVDLTQYAVYAASVGAVDPYCRRAARLEWAAAINNECSAFIITAPGHDIARAPWKYQICIKNRQLGLEWAVVTGRVELTPRACGTDGISPAAYTVSCEATPSGLVNVTLDATVGSISGTLEQVKASAAAAAAAAQNAHADLEDSETAATKASQAALAAAADAKVASDKATAAEAAATAAPEACAPYVQQTQQAAAAALGASRTATAAAAEAQASADAAAEAQGYATRAESAQTAAVQSAADAGTAATTATQQAGSATAQAESARLAATTATTAADNARSAAARAEAERDAAEAAASQAGAHLASVMTQANRAAAQAAAAADSASAAQSSAESAASSAASLVVNQTHDGTSANAESGAVIQGLIDDEELRQLVSRAYAIYAIISNTTLNTTDSIMVGPRADGGWDLKISQTGQDYNVGNKDGKIETYINTKAKYLIGVNGWAVPVNGSYCRVLLAPNSPGGAYDAGHGLGVSFCPYMSSKSVFVDFRSATQFPYGGIFWNVKKIYAAYGTFDKVASQHWLFCKTAATSIPDHITMPVLERAVGLFSECPNLERLPDGMSLSLATNCNKVFSSCPKLTHLPSSLTMESMTDGRYAFNGCSSLEELPEGLTFKSLTKGDNMFAGCYKLKLEHLARVLGTINDLQVLETPTTGTICLPTKTVYGGETVNTSQKISELYPELMTALSSKGWSLTFA